MWCRLPALLLVTGTCTSLYSEAALASPPPMQRRRAVVDASGFDLEWLFQPAPQGSSASAPPVLFIHGSFHGAWCWERWMERFATSMGCACHAVSLRGTSGSPCEESSVKISQHVKDLTAFVNGPLAAEGSGAPPVIVGHSFGGASLLKYLEAGCPASAAVLLCSVPPSGNSPMTLRFLRRSPLNCWRLLRGFAFKAAAREAPMARELFFDESMREDELGSYLTRFAADCQVGIDLAAFNADLPSLQVAARGCTWWESGGMAWGDLVSTRRVHRCDFSVASCLSPILENFSAGV